MPTSLRILLITVILSYQYVSYGQDLQPTTHPITARSPNASAMEQYGSYNVNLFNGLPQISIPIYEIRTKNLHLPITLNYHASGIKVADVASWVGLGWNLSTGGQITRKVKGRVDELGDFMSGFRSPEQLNPYSADGYLYLARAFRRNQDVEPDIFSYSLPGKGNGHFFYLNANDQPKIVPYEAFKVERTAGMQYGFKVTDDMGIKYNYGRSLSGVDYTESSGTSQGGAAQSYISTWPLSDIVSADAKEHISLSYHDANDLTLPNSYDDYVTIIDNINKRSADCNMASSVNTSYTTRYFSVSQRLLKEITFEDGKIQFILTQQNRDDLAIPALSRINIYSKVKNSYQLLKSFHFHYSYFGNGQSARLRLDELRITHNDGGEDQVYRFSYNTSVSLPDPTSKSIDLWGYFNDRSNTTLLPRQHVQYVIGPGGENNKIFIGGTVNGRDPNPSAMDAAVLRRIQYPTGGYTIFNFEPNKYVFNQEKLIGGGLRIKSILNYSSPNAKPEIKSYSYGLEDGDESGYGILNSQMARQLVNRTLSGEQWGAVGFGIGVTCTYRLRTFTSNPLSNINDFDQSNVNYPFVTEYGGEGDEGKTTYLFSNPGDFFLSATAEVQPYAESLHWRRGKLLKKKVYESNAGSFTPKREQENVYHTINSTTYANAGMILAETVVRQSSPEHISYTSPYELPFRQVFYSFHTGKYALSQSIERDYSDGQTISKTTAFSYNKDAFLSNTKEVRSLGDTLIKRFTYVSDFQSSNPVGDSRGIINLKNLHVLRQPIEDISWLRSAGGTLRTNSAMLRTFNDTKPVLQSEYMLQISNPSNPFTPTVINASGSLISSAQYEPVTTYTNYDTRNNPTNYYINNTPKANTALIWGYGSSKITAEITHASDQQVAYSSFEDLDKGYWSYDEAGVRKNVQRSVSDSSVFDFSATSQKQITKSVPAGRYIVSYWGTAGCKVNGADGTVVESLAYKEINLYRHEINFSGSGTITVTSSNAIIDDLCLAPSASEVRLFSHRPGVGVTSISESNRQFTAFSYDGLQRLREVRDTKGQITEQFIYTTPIHAGLGPIPTYYFNTEISGDFQKNDCPGGNYGTTVTYYVSGGKHFSTISQQDAQNKAVADLNANGQRFANETGECRSNSEVVWEPIDPYCQLTSVGAPKPGIQGYGVTTASIPNMDTYTRITVERANASFRAKATVDIYFTAGNKITAEVIFERGAYSVERIVGTHPFTSGSRAGAAVVDVEDLDQLTFTGFQVFERRIKRVGGNIVLTEPNLRDVGEGPFYEPVMTHSACPPGYAEEPVSGRAAYVNAPVTKDFFKECPNGATGSRVFYSVPAGKFTSSISQQDADNKAMDDVNANGQAHANQTGYCY